MFPIFNNRSRYICLLFFYLLGCVWLGHDIYCSFCVGIRLKKGLLSLEQHEETIHVSIHFSNFIASIYKNFRAPNYFLHIFTVLFQILYTQEEKKSSLIKTSDGTSVAETVLSKEAAGNCNTGTLKKRSSVSRVPLKKSSKHWLPGIQEDYNGPRKHRPKHH